MTCVGSDVLCALYICHKASVRNRNSTVTCQNYCDTHKIARSAELSAVSFGWINISLAI